MSAIRPKLGKGAVEATFDHDISDQEMDRLLAGRHDEIDAMLREAYEERARGDFAPLEPLEVLLREAREYAKTHR